MYKNQKHWLNKAITDGHIDVIQNTSLQHVELIAEGTFGKVSTAYLPNLGNLVVIKPLFDHNIDLNNNNDPYFSNYHQSYNDFVQDRYFMVLEHANGGTLGNYLLKAFNLLDWRLKIQMAIQIVEGIKFLHENGIVHRNLHPNNILINNNVLRITDYGYPINSKYCYSSKKITTIPYIDPACLRFPDHRKDTASDIYSLGVILWQLSSGRPPFAYYFNNNNNSSEKICDDILKGKRELPINKTPIEYIALYESAWLGEPYDRSVASVILGKLLNMKLFPVYTQLRYTAAAIANQRRFSTFDVRNNFNNYNIVNNSNHRNTIYTESDMNIITSNATILNNNSSNNSSNINTPHSSGEWYQIQTAASSSSSISSPPYNNSHYNYHHHKNNNRQNQSEYIITPNDSIVSSPTKIASIDNNDESRTLPSRKKSFGPRVPSKPITYINRCDETIQKYRENYGNLLGFEDPNECHAGLHAGIGDAEGLLFHLDTKNEETEEPYPFVQSHEKLLIIAARYCPGQNIVSIFNVLKKKGSNFGARMQSTNKNALHSVKYVLDSIKTLVKYGTNINEIDRDGRTLLSYYLTETIDLEVKFSIIKTILENGGDPNIPTDIYYVSGEHFSAPNSLFFAIGFDWSLKMFKLLVEKGAKVTNVINHSGDNLLSLTVKKERYDILSWLMENIHDEISEDDVKLALKQCSKITNREKKLLKSFKKPNPSGTASPPSMLK
ncbi:9593_t:CDS:2, partial [Entrophospora sp. SA101]